MYVIYEIRNIVNGKKYIGKTSNFNSRISCHKNLLFQGRHDIFQLQKDWDKYGSESFTFAEIACAVNNDKRHISKLEDEFIQVEKSCLNKFGYNKSTNAGWSNESRFRDTERKFIRKGKYRYIKNVSRHDPVAAILINTFIRSHSSTQL